MYLFRILSFLLLLQFLLVHPFLSSQTLADLKSPTSSVFRVVIDPGHGGADEGTVFDNGRTRIAEKDVTLRLARRVAYQLLAHGVHVTLTRNKDQEITLPNRTALANRIGADVFISIHMNSTTDPHIESHGSKDPEGIETYILDHATDASSRRLAHLENQILSTLPGDSPEQLDVALILKDLRLDANLSESKRLACYVQTNLVSATSARKTQSRRNRGVKQALFHVLLGADMPSILIEAGFLSSAHDRAFVLSPRGQSSISKAIAEAVDQFRHRQSTKTGLASLNRCKVN